MIEDNIYKSADTNTIVGLSIKKEAPLWLEGNQAVNTELNLFIVHYQVETGLLFIYSQLKTDIVYEAIADSFCNTHSKIPRDEMNRVLAGFTNYEFFNTGMQNRYAESGESYRIYAGSNTAASINETTGKMLSAGHAFCKATQNDSEITIGYSSGSKFWSSSYLPIPEYISWCDSFGRKIVNNTLVVKTNTNYDRLPFPTRIKQYQNNILFAFFSEKAYLSPPTLRIAGTENKVGLIIDADIKIVGITDAKDGIIFDFILGGITERLICNTDGVYSSTSPQFMCRDGSNAVPLFEYLRENPLTFKAADDTVYSGYEVLLGNVTYEQFDQSRITALDWNSFNTDVSVEARQKTNVKNASKSTNKNTVQETLQVSIEQDTEYAIIIFDHGTGEVADYITFKTEGSTIKAELYHCKAMKGKNYNSDVSDVYEVSQQAIKSTIWIKSKSTLLEKLLSRIKGAKETKFIRGDIKALKNLLKSQKILEVKIFIVQPAISKSKPMKDAVGTVLSAATFYITNTGRSKSLEFIGSA